MEPHRFEFGTILVATDLRGSSTSAMRYAQALAGRHGSKLILADVVDPVSYAFEREEAELYGIDPCRQEGLESVLHDIRVQAVVANPIPGRGAICRQILDAAEEHHADLLVLGTRGEDAVSRLALGRIARELAGRTKSSLITVPGCMDGFEHSAGMSRRVLAATDMTAGSLAGLRSAHAMVHGNLTLLHARTCMSGHECLNQLERLRSEAPPSAWRTLQVDHVVVQGEAVKAIVAFARKMNADLILLGSPGEVQGDVASSTVSQVVAQVACPVLCIARDEEGNGARSVPAKRESASSSLEWHVA